MVRYGHAAGQNAVESGLNLYGLICMWIDLH
jgi:hypothetical protein